MRTRVRGVAVAIVAVALMAAGCSSQSPSPAQPSSSSSLAPKPSPTTTQVAPIKLPADPMPDRPTWREGEDPNSFLVNYLLYLQDATSKAGVQVKSVNYAFLSHGVAACNKHHAADADHDKLIGEGCTAPNVIYLMPPMLSKLKVSEADQQLATSEGRWLFGVLIRSYIDALTGLNYDKGTDQTVNSQRSGCFAGMTLAKMGFAKQDADATLTDQYDGGPGIDNALNAYERGQAACHFDGH